MAILHEIRIELQSEGIYSPVGLAGFDEDLISKISSNLRRIGERFQGLIPRSITGATILAHLFTFGAKSQMQLIAVYCKVRCHKAVGRATTSTST